MEKELSAKNGPHENRYWQLASDDALQIQTSLWIARIQILRRQQPVALSPTYATCNDKSFASSRWMVRLYCSAYCVRGFLAACPNRSIGRNNDQSTGCPRRRIQNPVERIREHRAVLACKRRVELRVEQEGASAERRLRAELLQHQLFDRVIENTETGPNAGFSRPPENLPQYAIFRAGLHAMPIRGAKDL